MYLCNKLEFNASGNKKVTGENMRLQQNQIWKKGDSYLCIVELQRLSVKYKRMKDLDSREGEQHEVTKKVFCRLLKEAVLVSPIKD